MEGGPFSGKSVCASSRTGERLFHVWVGGGQREGEEERGRIEEDAHLGVEEEEEEKEEEEEADLFFFFSVQDRSDARQETLGVKIRLRPDGGRAAAKVRNQSRRRGVGGWGCGEE